MTTNLNNAWGVFNYELSMYFETRLLSKHLGNPSPTDTANRVNKNAVVESQILHTRIMVDILTSKQSGEDDIRLAELLPEFCSSIIGKDLIAKLKNAYGKRDQANFPCWTINKMLAHPTLLRSASYNYDRVMRLIEPPIFRILNEMIKFIDNPDLRYYVITNKKLYG